MSEPVTRGLGRLTMRQMLLSPRSINSASLKGAATRIGMSHRARPRACKARHGGAAALHQDQPGPDADHRGGLRDPPREGHAVADRQPRGSCVTSPKAPGRSCASDDHGGDPSSPRRSGLLRTLPERLAGDPRGSSVELLRLLDRGDLDLMKRPKLRQRQARALRHRRVPRRAAHGRRQPGPSARRAQAGDPRGSCRSRGGSSNTAMMPMRISLEQEYREAGLAFHARWWRRDRPSRRCRCFITARTTSRSCRATSRPFVVDLGAARTLNFRLRSKSQRYEDHPPQDAAPAPPRSSSGLDHAMTAARRALSRRTAIRRTGVGAGARYFLPLFASSSAGFTRRRAFLSRRRPGRSSGGA